MKLCYMYIIYEYIVGVTENYFNIAESKWQGNKWSKGNVIP